MSLTRAVGRNTAVQFVGKVIGTVLGVVTAAIIQRYLKPDGYGAYTAAMAYVGFFSVVADLGLYLILVRELNKPGADEQKVVGNLLALRWTSALLVLSLGTAAIWLIPAYSVAIKSAASIAAISFVAVAATQLLIGVFTTRLAMTRVAIAELVGRIVLLAATLAVTMQHGGLNWLMAAVMIGSLANFLIVFISAGRMIPLKLRFDFGYWRYIIVTTLPIAVSMILNLIYFKADTMLLSFFHKPNYDIGLYGAAYKIIEILITFPSIFVGLLLPALGRAFAEGAKERFVGIYQRGFDLLFMAILPVLIGGMITARQILVAVGKAEYAPGAMVLSMLLVAVAASFMNALSGSTVTIINKQKQMVWGYLAVAVVGIIAYVTLIPPLSYRGAAIGTIITEFLMVIISSAVVLRAMHFNLRFNAWPKMLLAGLVMGVIMYFARSWSLIASLPLGFAAYLAIIFVTRSMTWQTVKEIVASPVSGPSEITPPTV